MQSESGFREDPPENKIAFGIAQITPETFKALQDPKGEVKDFIFNDIRKKDLKNPNIAIPMAIRWLFRKKRLAEGKLGRGATAEEIILEYKGLLKSKSDEKKRALKNFKENYDKLKNK
ncbi:MAG: transglycosylase SLT domain-containing protein [Pseudobdellovibrionaceae bacterium]